MNRIDGFFDEPFAGYQYDSDSELYYVQIGGYDSAVGRWLSTEPVGLVEPEPEEKHD